MTMPTIPASDWGGTPQSADAATFGRLGGNGKGISNVGPAVIAERGADDGGLEGPDRSRDRGSKARLGVDFSTPICFYISEGAAVAASAPGWMLGSNRPESSLH